MFLQDLVQRFCVLPGTSQRRSPRCGSGYMLTVVALPVLLGIGALAIDLGLMGLAAQRTQHVADMAALAGATRAADAFDSLAVADETTSTNNSFSNWQVDTTMVSWGPGQAVPGYRALESREHVADVTGTTQFQFAFARVFGLHSTTITRRSAAICEVWPNGLGRGFVFAGSTDPNVWGTYSDGQGNRFNGSIHSNTRISLNGASNTLTGDIRYRNAFEQNGPNFTHDGDLIVTPVTPYPVDFTWEDFDRGPWDHDVAGISSTNSTLPSGRWRVRGDMTVRASNLYCSDALFVVDGNIYIEGADKYLDRVTLVAKGSVTVIGARGRISPYMHDLFAMSLKTSSSKVMHIDGSDCLASGIMFAPNGGLYWEGSAEQSYHVGLVASTITLMGSFSTHDGPATALVDDETSRAKLIL